MWMRVAGWTRMSEPISGQSGGPSKDLTERDDMIRASFLKELPWQPWEEISWWQMKMSPKSRKPI